MPIPDSCGAANGVLFDHLVGVREQRRRNRQAESPGGDEVHHQIKLSRLLDWDVARLRPTQDLVNVIGGAPEHTYEIWSIGHQASRLDEFTKFMHRRQSCAERQCADANPVSVKE